MSVSTRCPDRCPAAEKLASLQQAPVETWAGRDGNPSLPISQVVEIMSAYADMVTRLLPPFFSSVSPGPGREVRNGMGWSLLEKTARSGFFFFRWCLSGEQCIFCICCVYQLGRKRIVPYSLGGPPIFFVFLFILVWARHGCRATVWRAVLATASRCVEGYRSPNKALVC